LAIAIAAGAMGNLGFAVTSPILPDLADAFGVSRGAIGLVQAAVSIPGLLFSLVIGYLADRLGRRRVVLAALAIFTIFGVAGFFARSYWGLVGVRFLQGIGTSGILGVGIVLIGDVFTGESRTKAMGLNITGVTLMAITGPIVSGALATGGTFRPFLIFLIGIPLFAWVTRMPADTPKEVVAAPTRHFTAALRAMRSAGTLTDYIGLLVATLASVFVLHGLGLTVSPLFLDSEFGVPVSTRGLIVAGFQVGIIFVAARIAQIRARLGGATTMTTSFALMAIGSGVGASAGAPWMVFVGLAIAGTGFGLYVPVAQSFIAEVGTDRYRGISVLMWVTVVRLAQVIGPPVGSLLADGMGPRVAFWMASFGMAAITVVWGPMRSAVHRKAVTA
jgi:MFS family permease